MSAGSEKAGFDMEPIRMDNAIPVAALVIAPDRDLAAHLVRSAQGGASFQILAELKSYPPPTTLDIRMRQLKPHAVLIDIGTNLDTACELIRFLVGLRPVTHVVALAKDKDGNSVVKALRAGACEFLAIPAEQGQLQQAAARLRRLSTPEETVRQARGRVILFTSAKPGAGSSTLCTNAAHAARRLTGQKVLLVDMNMEGGSVAFLLKLPVQYSVVDALEQSGRLDAGLWSVLVSQTGGLDVLPAPEDYHSGTPALDQLRSLMEYCRCAYSWTFVDAPNVFHRLGLLLMSEADQALLVSSSDLASLHLARKAVNMLTNLGFSKDRYQIVVNRIGKYDGIATGDLEKIFNNTVLAGLPNDYLALHRVIALGHPLGPECALGRAVAQLASRLTAGWEQRAAGAPPAAPAAGN